MNIEDVTTPEERIAEVRNIVGGFGADLVMDCSGHPTAGPEGIEFLRDGGTKDAVDQAMAMKTVKSTIVPFDDLVVV